MWYFSPINSATFVTLIFSNFRHCNLGPCCFLGVQIQKVFFIVYVYLGRRPSFRSEKFEFCYVPHMLDVTSKMAFQKGVFYYWHDFLEMFGFLDGL